MEVLDPWILFNSAKNPEILLAFVFQKYKSGTNKLGQLTYSDHRMIISRYICLKIL